MKILLSLFAFSILFDVTPPVAAGESSLNGEKDRMSYSIGYQVGRDFKNQKLELRPQALLNGLRDALQGKESAISEQEMRAALRNLQQIVIERRKTEMERAAEENGRAGAAFLAANGRKDGVVTLPSGLQYKVIQEGEGMSPAPTDKVTVHYEGRLIDGTEFDSSISRGKPATFPVGGVIPGWTEALQLMKPGAKWRLFIPPDLAYGRTGAGGSIGPNSTLIFDVELISINRTAQ